MTRNKAPRVRFGGSMDEQLEATVAAIGFVLLLLLAGAAPIPEVGVVLQAGGVGAAVGLLVAYVRHRDEPEADRWRTVTAFSLIGLAAGLIVVLGDVLFT